jgi:hypothetical protein
MGRIDLTLSSSSDDTYVDGAKLHSSGSKFSVESREDGWTGRVLTVVTKPSLSHEAPASCLICWSRIASCIVHVTSMSIGTYCLISICHDDTKPGITCLDIDVQIVNSKRTFRKNRDCSFMVSVNDWNHILRRDRQS